MGNLLQLMFLPTGRASRSAFLSGLGATWLFMPVITFSMIFLGMSRAIPPNIMPIFGMIALSVPAWVVFCLFANRLHDLSKSGFWALVPALAPILFVLLMTGNMTTALTTGAYLLFFLTPIIYIGFALFLVCFKGSEAPNRFGERPALA